MNDELWSNKQLFDHVGDVGWETVMRVVKPSEIEDGEMRRLFTEAKRCFDNWDALCDAMYKSLQSS